MTMHDWAAPAEPNYWPKHLWFKLEIKHELFLNATVFLIHPRCNPFHFIVSQIQHSLVGSEPRGINWTCKRMIKPCDDEFCIALSNIYPTTLITHTHTQMCAHLPQHIFFEEKRFWSLFSRYMYCLFTPQAELCRLLWLSNSQWAVLFPILSPFHRCFHWFPFCIHCASTCFSTRPCLCLLQRITTLQGFEENKV